MSEITTTMPGNINSNERGREAVKSVEGMMMMMEWVTDLSIHNHNNTTTIETMMLWIEDKAFTITTALHTSPAAHLQEAPLLCHTHSSPI